MISHRRKMMSIISKKELIGKQILENMVNICNIND